MVGKLETWSALSPLATDGAHGHYQTGVPAGREQRYNKLPAGAGWGLRNLEKQDTPLSDNAPLGSIYLDTNPLRLWPHLLNNVRFLFQLASWLRIPIFVPDAVGIELEEQYMRSVRSLVNGLEGQAKKLRGKLREVAAIGTDLYVPDIGSIREGYRRASANVISSWQLCSIPIAAPPVAHLLEMAVRRESPFEEIEVRKGHLAVTGFQDAVILFSVLEHLSQVRLFPATLISDDSILRSTGVSALIKERQLPLAVNNLSEVTEALWKHVFDKQVVRAWEEEWKRVKRDLELNLPLLGPEILRSVGIDELAKHTSGSVLEVKAVSLSNLRHVRTVALPEARQIPPSSHFMRLPGQRVDISATVDASFEAVVQPTDYAELCRILFRPPSTVPPEPQAPKPPEITSISKTLELSLDAQFTGDSFVDFAVKDVQVSY